MWIKQGDSSAYKAAVKLNNRKWSALLYYNHNNSWANEVDSANLTKFSISDYSTDGSNITMGCVAGSKIEVKLIDVPKGVVSLWKDGETKIKLALLLETANTMLESVPYVIDSKKIVKRRKKAGETDHRLDVTLTAYDVSYLMTYDFKPSFTKGTAVDFVTYIADKYNLLVGSSVQSAVNLIDGVTANRQFDVLSDLTDKQTLGYMAGCYGCYAYINNYNEIEFGWYKSNGETVAPDRIFESGFYVSDMEQRKIVTLETGTQSNVLTPTVGGTASGYSIKYENPYINQAQVNAIYNQKISGDKTSFRIGKIKYKGDPLNMPGTVLNIEDIEGETATFYIMKRTLNYDGGLSETIECQGESESTIKYKAFSPMQQKIDKAISRLEEAAKGATDVITQTKGGVFELTPINPDEPTQGNKGFTITATEETNRNNKIVANIGGIGFSTDGGETIDAAAIYFDKDSAGNYVGRINAELIEAGSIGADKLQAGSVTADKIVIGDMANLVVADPLVYNTWNSKTYEDTSTYLTYFSVGNTASTAWGNDVILNRFYGADTFKVGDKFRFRAEVKATVANLKMVVLLAAYGESGQKIVNLIDHRITLKSGNQSVDFVCEVTKTVGGVPVAYHQVMVGLAPGVMGNFYFRNASLYKMTNGVLIEDGAITADKIAAGSITTDLIDSNVLKIGNISGLQDSLDSIETDLETAVEDSSAAADKASELDAKIAGWASANDVTLIDGAKIYTGSITANQIAANTITADKIKAGSITADKIKAGSITADKIKAGSITADKLTVGDMTNYNRVNSKSYSEWGCSIDGDGFCTLLRGNYENTWFPLSDWYDYQPGTSFRVTGTVRSNSIIDSNTYLQTFISLRILWADGTSSLLNEDEGAQYFVSSSTAPIQQIDCLISPEKVTTKTAQKFMVVAYHRTGAGSAVAPTGNLTRIKDLTVRAIGTDAGQIIAGKLSSVDGGTYFDLDTGEVSLKATNGDYYAYFDSAQLSYQWKEYHVGAIEGWLAQNTAANRRLMIYSPNIVEIGIGEDAQSANGTGLILSPGLVTINAGVGVAANIRAFNQTTTGGYVEMTSDSSEGGTLYITRKDTGAWGYLYVNDDGHLYWHGSIGTIQIA